MTQRTAWKIAEEAARETAADILAPIRHFYISDLEYQEHLAATITRLLSELRIFRDDIHRSLTFPMTTHDVQVCKNQLLDGVPYRDEDLPIPDERHD